MPARDLDKRQLAGWYPLRHARLGRQSRDEPVDDPCLEIHFRAGYQLLTGLQESGVCIRIQQRPADWAAKSYRVVLDTIPLPVIRDEFLMLTLLAVAPHILVTGLVTQHWRDGGVEYLVVLPGEGELETWFRCQAQDPGAELARFLFEKGS